MANPVLSSDQRTTPPLGMRPPVLVLVQGGIAAGKSTVTRLLVEQGATYVDCDRLAHEVLREPAIEAALLEAFGAGVFGPDGHVSRPALGQVVFSDPAALARLEALVHPRVRDLVRAALLGEGRPAELPRAVVVIDAAVASKMRLAERYDLTVFVSASLETRRARAATRGWAPGELERREANQQSLEASRQAAQFVVPNDGDLQETETHVQRLWSELVQPLR